MKINMEGCVNTLAMECMAFYHNFGGDGRNYTARSVYQCFYDPNNPDFVVINYDPDQVGCKILVILAYILDNFI